jgi:hypothetical protein
MKPEDIISKKNLKKLGFTVKNNAGGGLTEYIHKDCPFIRIECFMGVWYMNVGSIDQYEIVKYSGIKGRYNIVDYNPSNIERGCAGRPELKSNEDIIKIMLKWIDGAKKYLQSNIDSLQEASDNISSIKL